MSGWLLSGDQAAAVSVVCVFLLTVVVLFAPSYIAELIDAAYGGGRGRASPLVYPFALWLLREFRK